MKLIDLDPGWFCDKDGRNGQGISFLCPHCKKIYIGIAFKNPIDGGTPIPLRQYKNKKGKLVWTYNWERQGDTFENLTLIPSIDASEYGHWHGFIRDGNIT
jgi:hypothetical protein